MLLLFKLTLQLQHYYIFIHYHNVDQVSNEFIGNTLLFQPLLEYNAQSQDNVLTLCILLCPPPFFFYMNKIYYFYFACLNCKPMILESITLFPTFFFTYLSYSPHYTYKL